MIDRQVRYRVQTERSAQSSGRHWWSVLLINDKRNIDIILEKIVQELRPIEAFSPLKEGSLQIPEEDLFYYYLCFRSNRGKFENPSKIYNSRNLVRDRDLVAGKSEAEVDRYVTSIRERNR